MISGAVVGSWYRVWDIEDDGCGRNVYRGNNLTDQNGIFLLEDGYRGWRVRTVWWSMTVAISEAKSRWISCWQYGTYHSDHRSIGAAASRQKCASRLPTQSPCPVTAQPHRDGAWHRIGDVGTERRGTNDPIIVCLLDSSAAHFNSTF
jgi:hypothetical protein